MEGLVAAVAALLKKTGTEIESEVRGSSMHPTLIHGSRIRIRCQQGTYAPGDIIAIVAEHPIAHRVVGLRRCGGRLYLITRGDASRLCDAPVGEDRILGLVTAHYDGTVWRPPRALDSPSGLASVLPWLSRQSMLAALSLSEHFAGMVARGGAVIASMGGRRG